MYKIVALFALVALAAAQNYNRDPHTAAILNEQRYLNGDGKFGAAYSQEDGVEFKEESDADGTRRGSYSYVDPTGARKTVTYTAGKNGFQASGDHLPQAPQAPAHTAPQPQYQPQQQYNSPQQQYQQPQQQYQQPQQQYQQPQYNARSNSVEDDGQYRPDQYDQPEPTRYQQAQPQAQYQPQQQQHQFQQQAQPQQYQAPQQQYQPQQQQQQQQYQHTTQAPHRFYPPGKLSLNRSPDGFSYSFQKS